MERRFVPDLKQEVTVIDRAGIVGRGIVVGRTYSSPQRFDVAIKNEILKDLQIEDLRDG